MLYNGWRHFYFLYGPIIALAGLGLKMLDIQLMKSRTGKLAGIAALALVLLYQGLGIALNHPYQYAYYNELAADVQTDYELDYWELSTLNAMQQLAHSADRNPELPLILGGGDPMSLFSLKQSAAMLSADLRAELSVTEDADAPFVLSNSTYAEIYSAYPDARYQALFSVESYGNVICTVYERRE